MLKGKENIFEQIANNYKKLIITGVFKNGEYLPSCRELARELGINPNTVARAYKQLEDEGFVIALIKKGVYVNYNKNENKDLNEFKQYIKKLKTDGFSYEELIQALKETMKGENDLWFQLNIYIKALVKKMFYQI